MAMASRASSRHNNNTLTNPTAPTLLLVMAHNLLPNNSPRLRQLTTVLQLSLLTTTTRTTSPASAHHRPPRSSLAPSAGNGIKVAIGHPPRQPLILRIMPRLLSLYHLPRHLKRILKPEYRHHKIRNRSRSTNQILRFHKARRSQKRCN